MNALAVECDYLVVGAGSAGSVLAHRLSAERDNKVVVLESGGEDRHPYLKIPVGFLQALSNPALTWIYESEPEPQLAGRRIVLPRGRVLGGSSSINGMVHIRGNPRDFDEWRDLGCEGWGYADVLPYFRRSENSWRGASLHHGEGGPIQVNPVDGSRLLQKQLMEAAVRAGYQYSEDYDGALNEGFSPVDVAIDRRGRRSSTSQAYLKPIRGRKNLSVVTGAFARRIIFEGKRAVGVEFERDGKVQTLRARKEVIISGGAYNSPQLLMLSGIGPAEDLRRLGIDVVSDLPGVGGNLCEHPCMPLQYRASTNATFLRELRLDRATLSALRWGLLGQGPFSSQICSGNLLLKTRPDVDRPDIQLIFSPIRVDANLWLPFWNGRQEHCFFISVILLHAKSRGRLSLRSADPHDKPAILLNMLDHPDDSVVLREGLRRAREVMSTSPQAELCEAETLPGAQYKSDQEIEDVMRQMLGVTHHPTGTCAMGIGADSVVDPQLRVKGVTGLRVADASIMPTIPGANTNAASIMVGEVASDLVLGRKLAPATLNQSSSLAATVR